MLTTYGQQIRLMCMGARSAVRGQKIDMVIQALNAIEEATRQWESASNNIVENSNSADVKPEVGAQPPKREYNTARDEICTDIISNCICDYCVHKPGMASDYCGDCSGGSEFVGRKLRPC